MPKKKASMPIPDKPDENGADTVSVPVPRDSKGRFQPGCPAGPGRPPKPPEEQNLDLLHEILDEERVRAFITKLYIDSMRGDDEARKLLVRYLLPEPKVMADLRVLSIQASMQATNAEEYQKMNQLELTPEDLVGVFQQFESLGLVKRTPMGAAIFGESPGDEVSESEIESDEDRKQEAKIIDV